jgi:hypothetical protein
VGSGFRRGHDRRTVARICAASLRRYDPDQVRGVSPSGDLSARRRTPSQPIKSIPLRLPHSQKILHPRIPVGPSRRKPEAAVDAGLDGTSLVSRRHHVDVGAGRQDKSLPEREMATRLAAEAHAGNPAPEAPIRDPRPCVREPAARLHAGGTLTALRVNGYLNALLAGRYFHRSGLHIAAVAVPVRLASGPSLAARTVSLVDNVRGPLQKPWDS